MHDFITYIQNKKNILKLKFNWTDWPAFISRGSSMCIQIYCTSKTVYTGCCIDCNWSIMKREMIMHWNKFTFVNSVYFDKTISDSNSKVKSFRIKTMGISDWSLGMHIHSSSTSVWLLIGPLNVLLLLCPTHWTVHPESYINTHSLRNTGDSLQEK